MRLVVANPEPVRLDGPSTAPGSLVAVPLIGFRRLRRRSASTFSDSTVTCASDSAPAHASPAASFRLRLI